MSFHKAHTPGELIERVDGDVAALAKFFSHHDPVLGNGFCWSACWCCCCARTGGWAWRLGAFALLAVVVSQRKIATSPYPLGQRNARRAPIPIRFPGRTPGRTRRISVPTARSHT